MIQNIARRLKQRQNRLEQYYGPEFTSPKARFNAQRSFLWDDHGILRYFWANRAEISPGVWRANQPSPAHIEKYKDMGIRTILNLRGPNNRSHYIFEKLACEAAGIDLVDLQTNAHRLASKATYLKLLDLFETLDKPFLMHCKSGADRAGLASALYLMHIDGLPVAEAKKQLSARFIHFKWLKTGILDHMLDSYEADTVDTKTSIQDWIANSFDPNALKRQFETARGAPNRND
ncbi:MAG: tyrosine-protein phosphatase [Marinosulfonomonas sp.]|nr:tyrosine-protein phosphatase [Marinosulfonomonas sp.]